jgi:smad nuclear-interacting protein 1
MSQEEKEAPNYKASGLLSKEALTVSAGILKFSAPPEARMPSLKYRLYVFKDSENINIYHIHRQPFYLVGRDRSIVDIPVDHPSCSKQHAVIVFRQVLEKDELGLDSVPVVKPYILDLESSNGTMVNSKKIPSARYYQLLAGDVIQFGFSSRDYILMIEDLDHKEMESLNHKESDNSKDTVKKSKKNSQDRDDYKKKRKRVN